MPITELCKQKKIFFRRLEILWSDIGTFNMSMLLGFDFFFNSIQKF